MNGVVDGIKAIFIPSDGFLDDKVSAITDKFAFAESIVESAEAISNAVCISTYSDAPSISMNLNVRGTDKNVKIVDLSWYTPYKPYGDKILSGIIIMGFVWTLFSRLPSIIGGVSSGASSLMKIEEYKG